jgi:hypothetical protein
MTLVFRCERWARSPILTCLPPARSCVTVFKRRDTFFMKVCSRHVVVHFLWRFVHGMFVHSWLFSPFALLFLLCTQVSVTISLLPQYNTSLEYSKVRRETGGWNKLINFYILSSLAAVSSNEDSIDRTLGYITTWLDSSSRDWWRNFLSAVMGRGFLLVSRKGGCLASHDGVWWMTGCVVWKEVWYICLLAGYQSSPYKSRPGTRNHSRPRL